MREAAWRMVGAALSLAAAWGENAACRLEAEIAHHP